MGIAIGSRWLHSPRYATQPPEHRGIPGNGVAASEGESYYENKAMNEAEDWGTHTYTYIYVYIVICIYIYVYTQYTYAIYIYIYYIYLFICIFIWLSANSLVVSTFCFNHAMMIQYVYIRNWDAPPNASIINY